MFKVGDRVKRVASEAYPSKYDGLVKPDNSGQGHGLIGVIISISEGDAWPLGSGRIFPKLYFVQFQGRTGGLGLIEEHLMLLPFVVGDRVTVQTVGSEPKDGTIVELWAGSNLERTTGQTGLDKYHVHFNDGCDGWFYGSDIRKN